MSLKPIALPLIAVILVLSLARALHAQQPGTDTASVTPPKDHILLTVFLQHDQSKTLDEIGKELDATGFWTRFPPEGAGVESKCLQTLVSWNRNSLHFSKRLWYRVSSGLEEETR